MTATCRPGLPMVVRFLVRSSVRPAAAPESTWITASRSGVPPPAEGACDGAEGACVGAAAAGGGGGGGAAGAGFMGAGSGGEVVVAVAAADAEGTDTVLGASAVIGFR